MKKVLFVALLLVFNLVAFGRPGGEMTKEELQERFLDYSTVKLTWAFMEDYENASLSGEPNISLSEKEKKSKVQFGDFASLPFDLNNDTILRRAENFLQKPANNWHQKGLNVFNFYKENLTGPKVDELLMTFEFSREIYSNPLIALQTNDREKSAKQALIKEWGNIKTQIEGHNSAKKYKENGHRQKAKLDRLEKELDLYKVFTKVLILTSLIWVILLVLLLRKNKKLRADQQRRKSENRHPKRSTNQFQDTLSQLPNSEKASLERKVLRLESDKDELIKENRSLSKKLTEIQSKSSNSFKKDSSDTSAADIAHVVKTTFYIPMPIRENIFNLSDAKKEPQSNSLYKFIGDNKSGEFEVYTEKIRDYTVPLGSHEDYFKLVCDYENKVNIMSHTKVIMLKAGKYKIEGNDIIVTEKALIKFA